MVDTSIDGLRRTLAKNGPASTYLVMGTERLLVDEAVTAILQAAVEDPRDAMSVTRVDLAEGGRTARDVVGACHSLGLFATRQAVVVRAADVLEKRTEDRDELTRYVTDPNPATTLILVATKINGSLALVKRIKKHGSVLSYGSMRAWKVPDWVLDESRRLGHRMNKATAKLIADLAGTELQKLRLVMQQLSLYVGPDKPIEQEAVEDLLAATRTHTVFELVDAVGDRHASAALEHLNAMLGHREPPLRILAMLIRHFRLLWQVAEARHLGEPAEQVSKRLSLHSFVAKKLWAQCTKFDERSLRRAYDSLYKTDLRLKSAGLDDGLVMERLVLDLCG